MKLQTRTLRPLQKVIFKSYTIHLLEGLTYFPCSSVHEMGGRQKGSWTTTGYMAIHLKSSCILVKATQVKATLMQKFWICQRGCLRIINNNEDINVSTFFGKIPTSCTYDSIHVFWYCEAYQKSDADRCEAWHQRWLHVRPRSLKDWFEQGKCLLEKKGI